MDHLEVWIPRIVQNEEHDGKVGEIYAITVSCDGSRNRGHAAPLNLSKQRDRKPQTEPKRGNPKRKVFSGSDYPDDGDRYDRERPDPTREPRSVAIPDQSPSDHTPKKARNEPEDEKPVSYLRLYKRNRRRKCPGFHQQPQRPIAKDQEDYGKHEVHFKF